VRLTQVFGNLLNNAAKYTPEGGHVSIVAEAAGGEAVVTVEDDGHGIEPRLLPQVFELFVQGERSLDRSQGGLGIGLTLVKRLVELHQGRVEAYSDGIGRGARFRVFLPCVASVAAPARDAREGETPRAARSGRRVLIVDDNVDAAEILAAYLRLEGHEAKVLSDGTQLMTAAEVFEPQAIVLDIGLPGLNGYELAKQLRANAATSRVLLIALTGYGSDEDRARAAEAGFDCHSTKPAGPPEIQAAIERGRAQAGGVASPRSTATSS
jgi:CheY-like chemotaxis protein